jgi:beta-fructofuranosidase
MNTDEHGFVTAIRRLVLSGAVIGMALGTICSAAETDKELLVRATAAMQGQAARAQADPARPIFHVTSPAQWVNDPNGPIFYKGYYHLFYQLDPFSDKGGIKYWGHVRSRDLAKWEHLPIAIAPSNDKGEESIWSGCCTINGKGQPMIFYTSIAFGKSPLTHAEQWAATSDDDLIHWQKSPANPVVSEELHGDKKIYDWRDPFIFHHQKRTFMVLGGSLNESKGGQAVVNIYEGENAELTKWKYRGVLFQHPDANVRTSECPNFFQLGNQWVLFVSPYGKVQYFIGDFDAETCRFQPRSRGLLDNGPNFYAPNTMLLADGRRLVWGWVNGFRSGPGWNGCLSLPRELSISRDGQLKQAPAPQLAKLRGKSVSWRNVRLKDASKNLALPATNTLEILAEVELKSAKSVALEFKRGAVDAKPIVVSFDGAQLQVGDAKSPLQSGKGKTQLQLRMFFDRSVMEVFANETVCVTKTVSPLSANTMMNIQADGGEANFKSIQIWPMKSIWY